MTYANFVALVADMRETQRQYFLKRTGALLSRSKVLEKEVDRAIADFRNKIQPAPKQASLIH